MASKTINVVCFNFLKTTKNKNQFVKIAYLFKAHGIKGEVFALPFNTHYEWPQNLKEIFIGDSFSCFPITKYRPHKKGVIFELQSCRSREKAESLKGELVFLPKKLFKSKKGEALYLAELMSFCVEVSGVGKIGSIHSFQSSSSQDFLVIKKKKGDLLIPFVKAYIKKIHFSRKTIILELPKNFLEMIIGDNRGDPRNL